MFLFSSPSKIVAGIHFTGPKIERDLSGEYTKFGSEYTFSKICESRLDVMWQWPKSIGKFNLALYYTKGGENRIVIESCRSIANKVRYAMKRGLIGILAENMPFDDMLGNCLSEVDIFWDFKPGTELKKPPLKSVLGFNFPFLHTISDSIHMTLHEMAQKDKIFGNTETTTSTVTTAVMTTPMITETTVLVAETSTLGKISDASLNYGSDLVDIVIQGISNPLRSDGIGSAHYFINNVYCMTLMLLSTFVSILFWI